MQCADRQATLVFYVVAGDIARPPRAKGLPDNKKNKLIAILDDAFSEWETQFADEASAQFDADRVMLIADLNRKANVDWVQVEQGWQEVYAQREDDWREAFVPLISGLIVRQGEALNALFGLEFDVQNLFALQWFNDYKLKFAQPIWNTNREWLSRMLQQAQLEGWSIPEMEDQLGAIFRVWGDQARAEDNDLLAEWVADRLPQARRELIARTETLRSSSAGSFHLYKAWGSPMKEWMATGDDRTRPSHMEAWDNYREGGLIGPIPIDQPFIIGGYLMMYPGDPNGPIEEFANCRCTVVPYNPAWNMSEDELAEVLSESQIAKPGA